MVVDMAMSAKSSVAIGRWMCGIRHANSRRSTVCSAKKPNMRSASGLVACASAIRPCAMCANARVSPRLGGVRLEDSGIADGMGIHGDSISG